MTFHFNQLDKISDFDQALDILEAEYIPALIETLAHSPEGQTYLKAHPETANAFGGWVDTFVQFGYRYLEVTLPKMKQQDAETILLNLFPRKLSLTDTDEADTAIPELIALWEFLQRQYKQRHSKAILTLLRRIQPSFKATMNDPRNFGMAKSLFTLGQDAGFDMTTQEGLQAFQQQYNQQLQETGAPPPGFPALQSPTGHTPVPHNPLAAYPIPEGVPPEFVALLSQSLGFSTYPGLEHLPSDPNQLVEAIAQHLIASGEVILDETRSSGGNSDFIQDFQANVLSRVVEQQKAELSEEEVFLLRQQTITETEPGTIVRDFEAVLEAMGDREFPVSGKLQHIAAKTVVELNAQLSHPIQTAFQRPVQRSYPNIHGLYLLLRVTGLAEIRTSGKSACLKRNPAKYAAWQRLNPTEKYFTLLEAWIIRGIPELLGEERNPFSEGSRVLQTWPHLISTSPTYKSYAEQSRLNYWPGLHNLALMQMFGWVNISTAKPEAGKGWRVKRIQSLPMGEAMVRPLLKAYIDQDDAWDAQSNLTHPWGDLQPYFQTYFPEWQQNLPAEKAPENQTGIYIFKVTLGKIWRRLAVPHHFTLERLGDLIRESMNFDSDHLDMFTYKDTIGHTINVCHPFIDDHEGKFTHEVEVGDLPLKPGTTMTYLFDFGDRWQFTLLLEEIQPDSLEFQRGRILEEHGKAPEQQ